MSDPPLEAAPFAVERSGHSLSGEALGDGPPVILCHGLTATRRDWRRRGVATALKQAEIAAAKRAGFHRLVTESEERNEPMRRLNLKLGFVPAPELSTFVMRGPVV